MENELPRIADDSPDRVEWWLSSAGLESHFRSVADSIPALAALLRPTGEIEVVNRQTLDYFGATLAQLKAGAIPDLIHPDDLPNAPRVLNDHTRGAFDYEVRLRRSDGVYRWFNTRAFPLRDPGGRIVLWYLLQTDLDDIKRVDALLAGEKRVLEMVARGQSLAEVIDALCRLAELAIAGSYCSVRLVSPRGDQLLIPTAPSLPASFAVRVGGCALELDACPGAMAVLRSEQVIVGDLTTDTRWGGTEWRSATLLHGIRACWSTPIKSAEKKVLGIVEILNETAKLPTALDLSSLGRFTDLASIIIERAQREDALRRSEAFLAEAQRVSSTGSFSWRPATNEIVWSDELHRMFEIDRVEPMTPELTDLRVHPEDLPLLYEKVNQARLDGRDFEHDYRLSMPDGSIKHMHTVFHRNQDADGQVEFIGAIQDVSQQRVYADALAKAQSDLAHVARVSTLGQLTASIAHEVNQPLAGIIMNASTCLRMLAADPPNVDGAQETARRTIRDAHRAADVVTRLRALFDKKSEGNEWVDLNEATREVIALSTRELQRDRVVLKLALANDLPRVRGDRVQLQQVILNLVLNACESMRGVVDPARELTITTERDEGEHVRLSVRDGGTGFDDQVAERMFEAFYTTKQGGMGIGLSVSRSIVESHRGRLWAAANDGPGAIFSLSIPCGTFDGSVACTADAPPNPPRTGDPVQAVRSLE